MENSSNQSNNRKDNRFLWWAGPVLLIAIIGLWLLTYFLLKDDKNRGTFGDMFGSVNALFSGLAFGGIILTIILQMKELRLQREELIETRKELKRSAGAQERSEKALVRQANNLKKTAVLNALNTLIEYYNNPTTHKRATHTEQARIADKLEMYLERIEEILNEKDDEG